MTTESGAVHGSYVIRDSAKTWRLFDAYGPKVIKYIQDFQCLPVDDTSHDPTEFTNTIVETGTGSSTCEVTDVAGGALLITTAQRDNDGYKMQLGHASTGAGETVDFSGSYPTYFGVQFKLSDVDQMDALFGFCITDTACLDAVSDGLYFRTVDGSSSLYLVLEKDSDETATACTTLTDDTYVTAEFYYDGDTISAYIDGTLAATVEDTDTNMPDDELLRLTMEVLSGASASADTCHVKWIRYIQIQQA